MILQGFGKENLMKYFKEQLRSHNDEIVAHILYCIVNILTGNEQQKGFIYTDHELLGMVYEFMSHESGYVRMATIWIVINLTWREGPGMHERISTLRKLNFEEKLKQMTTDADTDVRDRVKTALQNFQEENP